MTLHEFKIINGLQKSLEQQMRSYPDQERQDMLTFVVSTLPEFIKEHLDSEYKGIFEETRASYYSNLRRRLATNAMAREMDDFKYSIGLQYLAQFISSKFYPKPKVKVVRTVSPSQSSVDKDSEEEDSFVEGTTVQTTVDRRERNSEARNAAIRRDGFVCRVCGFDFEKTYGKTGRHYIEVHHIQPISQFDEEHEVIAEHLVCLCANCHAMAHRRRPEPFSIEELKEMIQQHRAI